MFGGPVAWPLMEKFGRKPALLFSAVPALIGWVVLAVSNLLPNRSGFLAFMYIGRIVTGFSAGWISFCIPVSIYIPHVLIQPTLLQYNIVVNIIIPRSTLLKFQHLNGGVVLVTVTNCSSQLVYFYPRLWDLNRRVFCSTRKLV